MKSHVLLHRIQRRPSSNSRLEHLKRTAQHHFVQVSLLVQAIISKVDSALIKPLLTDRQAMRAEATIAVTGYNVVGTIHHRDAIVAYTTISINMSIVF